MADVGTFRKFAPGQNLQDVSSRAFAGAGADTSATSDLVLIANTQLTFATDGATEIRSNPPVVQIGHANQGH